jgi:hypothetical protein
VAQTYEVMFITDIRKALVTRTANITLLNLEISKAPIQFILFNYNCGNVDILNSTFHSHPLQQNCSRLLAARLFFVVLLKQFHQTGSLSVISPKTLQLVPNNNHFKGPEHFNIILKYLSPFSHKICPTPLTAVSTLTPPPPPSTNLRVPHKMYVAEVRNKRVNGNS